MFEDGPSPGGERPAERKQQSRSECEPWKNTHESVSRSLEQEKSSSESACEARDQKRDEDTAGDIETLAIGATTCGCSGPQRNGVCCVCRNGWDAREE